MKCNNCNAENLENAIFCTKCGYKLMSEEKKLNDGKKEHLESSLYANRWKCMYITGVVLIILFIALIVHFKQESIKEKGDILSIETENVFEEIQEDDLIIKNENMQDDIHKRDRVHIKYSLDKLYLELPCSISEVFTNRKNAIYRLESEFEYASLYLEHASDEEIREFIDYNSCGNGRYSVYAGPPMNIDSETVAAGMLGWIYLNDFKVEGIFFSQSHPTYWDEIVIEKLSVTDPLDEWVEFLGEDYWTGINYLNNKVLCWDVTPLNLAIAVEINNSEEIESVFIGNNLENYIDSTGIYCVTTERENEENDYFEETSDNEQDVNDIEQLNGNKALSLDEVVELASTASDGIIAVHRGNEFYVLTDERKLYMRDSEIIYINNVLTNWMSIESVLFAEKKVFSLQSGDEIVIFSNNFTSDEISIHFPLSFFWAFPLWIDEYGQICIPSGGFKNYTDCILNQNGQDDIPKGD